MVISSFISSILVLALGIWAFMKLESSMNIVAEKQLLIEPTRFSYKMWKDMPVTMYQSFTFFNLTNWNQVKAIGQKPKFVEVGPYVYRTIWTKSDINFMDEDRLVSFSEKKQWIFQPHLSKGSEDDQIWTINTPLMTALALIQNAPVITRNIVSVILDGLGEGAFIKRNIRSLLFEGYSDLIVSVGPLFDRRFANFNGKFAYLYNKNDSIDGTWTVSTGVDDMSALNKITRFQSSIVNMTTFSSGQQAQGLNEVKAECAPAWSLDQASNGQLFSPFNRVEEEYKLQQQLQQLKQARSRADLAPSSSSVTGRAQELVSSPLPPPPSPAHPKRFFSRSTANHDHQQHQQHLDLVPNPFLNQKAFDHQNGRQLTAAMLQQQQQLSASNNIQNSATQATEKLNLKDVGKFIFYPDLCRPIHLLPSRQEVTTSNGIQATRFFIDPRVFMNSTQVPTNRCYEMNPRPPLANALAATINSVTGTNVAMPLVTGASSPFAIFSQPSANNHHHHHHNHENNGAGGLFERSNHPTSFINNALHGFGATIAANQDQQASSSNNAPVSRLGRVRQLFSNIVSQRMSAGPGSLLPTLAAGPAGMLIGNPHFPSSNARNSPDEPVPVQTHPLGGLIGGRQNSILGNHEGRHSANLDAGLIPLSSNHPHHHVAAHQPAPPAPAGGSDRWITQFRFKWPKGVFSIGQCQLGAPIYASLPHFLDADEYYLEQVDGLRPNRSLHEFYIDLESNLHSIPVGAKARLQLNVATPELRFRNIPNAMIPVLWQEVTFEIDKPIATMLYWSFTMSPTIYKLISILLLIVGTVLLVVSLVGGFKEHSMRRGRRGKRAISGSEIDATSSSSSSSGSKSSRMSGASSSSPSRHQEGQSSSWRPRMMLGGGNQVSARIDLSNNNINNQANNNETMEEIRHGAAFNRAFSLCTEFHDRLNEAAARQSGPVSNHSAGSGSPKQPSSRASSHCELVSSVARANLNPIASVNTTPNTPLVAGAASTCAGCLLACLRHSPAAAAVAAASINGTGLANNNHNHNHNHHLHIHDHHLNGTSDSSLVIQQVTCASDIDKATLSSRGSNLDSCSSIYNQQRATTSRTFKS